MQKISNIVVFRNDRFGEFLLNIPAFAALKKGFPGARLVAVVNPYVQELANRIDCIDGIITFDNKNHSLGELLRFSKALRERRFDLGVVFNPSRELHVASFLAGIPVRVGYRRKLGGYLLTRTMEDRKHEATKHEVEYNLELAGLLGVKTDDTTLSLTIGRESSDVERKFALDAVDNIVTIHPWTSDPLKQWPVRRFFQLTKVLSAYPGIRIILVGQAQATLRSNELFLGLEKCAVDLCGKTTLVELAAILKRSRLLISGDSGPVHLASAVGTKTLVLFRNDIPGKEPKRWGPWGPGHTVIAKQSLMDIEVEEVLRKAKEVLGI
ncbi:MAG: glycosyltransferase family 9 protein [Candidatus Omnitrophica bacterium]|nr:glycosyltransferase family 9 protein [Candidatus Omnitrophota bacterium]